MEETFFPSHDIVEFMSSCKLVEVGKATKGTRL